MKKFIKFATSLVAAAALALGCASAAFADDSSVTFKDHEEAFVFVDGTEWHATDLFGNFKGVMPGDNLRQAVTVTNEDPDGRTVSIYMRAEAHDEAGNPLQTAVSETETVASMQDFLAQMTMTVRLGDQVLFQGQPHLEGGLADYVSLGEFATGESKQLEVTLSVPIEMGDEYANRAGEVDWVFYVEELDPVIPDEPEPTPEPVEPSDEPADKPELGPIEKFFAKTGDSAPFAIVAIVACVAAAVVVVAAFAKRRRA